MPYTIINMDPTVQVFGPNLAGEARVVTFYSFPSGSVLIYTLPEDLWHVAGGPALELNGLSDATEELLNDPTVVGGTGTQGLDNNGLVFDAVTFTVQYVPPNPIPGQILGDVQIPVDVILLDVGLSHLPGVTSAADLIQQEYNRLQAAAQGSH